MSSLSGGQRDDGEEPIIGRGQHTREDADRADRWQRDIYVCSWFKGYSETFLFQLYNAPIKI